MQTVEVDGRRISLRKVDPQPGQHSTYDPKAPTRYKVMYGLTTLGWVESRSRRVVKTRLPSGAIVSYARGFGRNWVAKRVQRGSDKANAPLDNLTLTETARNRQEAVEVLVRDAIRWGAQPT